jgi:hypothetical protein
MQVDIGFGGLQDAISRLREMDRLTASIARNMRGASAGAGGVAQSAGGAASSSVGLGGRLSALAATGGGAMLGRVAGQALGGGAVAGMAGAAAGLVTAAAGPLGLAVGAAGTAITTFSSLLQDASKSVGEFNRATTTTGGTAAQTAAIAAMGIAPGQQAGAAAQLREQLAHDPIAIMMGQRAGVGFQLPRPFGETNEAKLLETFQKGIRALVDTGKAEDALRVARVFNLESMVEEAMVSRRIRDARDADAQTQAEIYGRNAQTFRDFESQGNRAAAAFANLGVAIGGQFAPAVDRAMGQIAETVNGLANLVNRLNLDPTMKGTAWEGLYSRLEEQQRQQNPQHAQDKNTAALNENTTALKNVSTGPRASGSFPAELRGRKVAEDMEQDRVKLGVFGN